MLSLRDWSLTAPLAVSSNLFHTGVASCQEREGCEGVRNVLKVSELNNSVKERAYQESFHGKYEVWRGGEDESVEKEWEKFRDMVMECTNDVCGMRCVGRQRRKGSEWWNEEVGRAVAKKRRAFEEWIQRRDRVTFDRYRVQRVAVNWQSKLQKE